MPTKDKQVSPNDYVYLARRERDGILKIGTSADPLSRIGTLAIEHKSAFTLLAIADGSYPLEAELHARFAQYAYNEKRSWQAVEWFHPVDEIFEYARTHMRDPIELARQKRFPHQLVIKVEVPKPSTPPAPPKPRKKRVHVALTQNRAPELIAAKEEFIGRKLSVYEISRDTGVPYNAVTRLIKRRDYTLTRGEWNAAMFEYLGCAYQELYPFDFQEYTERGRKLRAAANNS